MAKEKPGGYYGCLPWLTEELLKGKIITIETKDNQYFVYDVRGKVPKLIYYSSNIQFIHSR
ncbi:hypothetical protein ACTXLQ_12685 [Enterococcus hirae]|uniref:hypothetical protein n=1 Tax=Enterococcus hirae TaxID=1354 RepID=UPI0037C23BE7